ncbi:MAG TPA: hypothetical protein VGH66_00380 [Acidimicrobiales bacterium]|jgi:hypothetical protein
MARIEYHTLPVRAFMEHTVCVPAGAVTFGVEYRRLDEATILAEYGPDAEAKFGGIRPAGMGQVVEEDGVALHVFDQAAGQELLRFDCFDDAPHYHLLAPQDSRNIVIEHDAATLGPLLDWALAQLGTRLPALLREAGAGAVADRVDGAIVASALETVEQVARYVQAAGRPVLVS